MSNISQLLPFQNILQPTLEFEYYCYAHWDTHSVTCNFFSFSKIHLEKVHQNVCLMLLLKYTRRINILWFNVLSSKSRTSLSLSLYSLVFSVYHYYYHDQHKLTETKFPWQHFILRYNPKHFLQPKHQTKNSALFSFDKNKQCYNNFILKLKVACSEGNIVFKWKPLSTVWFNFINIAIAQTAMKYIV